jgi:hypothetical protein
MQTLSEFMTLVNAASLGLGGIYGAKKGNQYSKEGKTRLQLTKDLGRKAVTAGAVNTLVQTALSRGKNIGKNLTKGLKTSATLGGSSIVGGQLGYRNKYYTATNPDAVGYTVNNVLGGYEQNRKALSQGSGYTEGQADEYANEVARNYNLSNVRGKDPNKGLTAINKKWNRKVRSDKGKQRGKYDLRT